MMSVASLEYQSVAADKGSLFLIGKRIPQEYSFGLRCQGPNSFQMRQIILTSWV